MRGEPVSRLGRFLVLLAVVGALALLLVLYTASSAILTHGPVVGAVTTTSATVFVRTNKEATVSVVYSENRTLSPSRRSAGVLTSASSDFTRQIVLDSLAPSSTYYLDVLVNGRSQLARQRPSFATYAPDSVMQDFSFVVLTDFAVPRRGLPYVATFRHASAENPAFVLIGGDFDHRDPSGASAEIARAAKRQMFKQLYRPATWLDDIISAVQHRYPAPSGAMREFTDLVLRRYPVVHVWDDHDFGANDSDKTYPWKAVSQEVIREYFPLYGSEPNGIWQRFRYAQADVFILDLRSQRDPDPAADTPDKSILDGDNLGAAGQMAWLQEGLRTSTARWKFIVSTSVFNPTLRKYDSWSDYTYEQRRLLDFIKTSDITGVIILSGDVHFGAIDDGSNAKLPEMVSPGANMDWGKCGTVKNTGAVATVGLWSQGIYEKSHGDCNGYGLVRVLSNPDRVELLVKGPNGDTLLRHTVQ